MESSSIYVTLSTINISKTGRALNRRVKALNILRLTLRNLTTIIKKLIINKPKTILVHSSTATKTEASDLCIDVICNNTIYGTILDILQKLPRSLEISKVKESFQMKLYSTGVVLLQELQLYNRLVDHIGESLKLLREVCTMLYIFSICTFY